MKKGYLSVKVFAIVIFISLFTLPTIAGTWMETDFDDFADGSFDSGGNIFASIAGELKIIGQQWDLNGDGFLDIVFNNSYENSDSYIYWGSIDGFSVDNRTELPTKYAASTSVDDLNGDGFPDIVFANHYDQVISSYNINSFIYWGSANGFSSDNRDELPTHGAVGSSVADLDRDGFLDIIFSNRFNNTSYNVDSFIYWGSENGFSIGNKTELQTYGAVSNSVCDLNEDSYLDIVFSNSYSDSGLVNCFIYWGAGSGFSNDNRTELSDYNTYGNSVADLNKDGFLDIVFSNRYTASFIYWGSANGFSDANKTGLEIHGGHGCSIADLDCDNFLDIVFSNHYYENSYIYWGTPNGYSSINRLELPTVNATGNLIADFDNNSLLDIAFCNGNINFPSFIYWGSTEGFSINDRKELTTQVANLVIEKDLGDVYTRQNEFI